MNKTLTCIGCPMGCQIEVELDEAGNFVSSKGWSCNIGKRYAQEEVTAPVRTVTALVDVVDRAEPLSVKTAAPIPKKSIFTCLDEIRKLKMNAPVHIGDIVAEDIAGTGISVVATKNIL
ncbi:MAG: DUF1667 domain-containing protein [Anaerolineaceae bacterium]|nr:DUF1667 domain-containing protein [Anaerolineaceae bacterium]